MGAGLAASAGNPQLDTQPAFTPTVVAPTSGGITRYNKIMATNSLARRNYVTALTTRLNLDLAKTILFYYVLATYALKVKRHVTARGIVASTKEVYGWAARVSTHLDCHLISGRD